MRIRPILTIAGICAVACGGCLDSSPYEGEKTAKVVPTGYLWEEGTKPTPFWGGESNVTREDGRVQLLSESRTIKSIYKSMTGPSEIRRFNVVETEQPELVWLTGYTAVMVESDGSTPADQQFMCHSNLDYDIFFAPTEKHNEVFSSHRSHSKRLFTLSQGQLEITFPEGFGIPVISSDAMSLSTQVLNLNDGHIGKQVRHQIKVHFVCDRELEQPYRPLFQISANGLVSLEDKELVYNMEETEETEETDGAPCMSCCIPGDNAGNHVYTDKFGKHFSGHWIVPPGRHEYRTLVTDLMMVPFDTTVHYIAVHLHPFAEELELRDLTAGKTLFKANAINSRNKIGLEHVDHYSSVEGFPVYTSHQYELVSTYHNTTTVDQDSMAVIYIYLLDQEFKRKGDSIAAKDARRKASSG